MDVPLPTSIGRSAPMVRIVRVPASLDTFFRTLSPRFHWDHAESVRLLVLAMALAWGRRHVANLYRSLAVPHHRTRFHTCGVVHRWDPAAALRQKPPELRQAVHPPPGPIRSRVIDDSKQATRGTTMAAVATLQEPPTAASLRGHPSGWGLLVYREPGIPFGIRREVTKDPCAAWGVSVRKTPELAAPLLRECQPPAGVKVMGLLAAYALGPPVVKACHAPGVPGASTRTSPRRLCTPGGKLQAGREGRHRCRRRRTATRGTVQPHGHARYRDLDAGGLQVRTRGPLPVVCSRTGAARKLLGWVTDAPERSAAAVLRTDARRWTMAPWIQDVQPLLGLGQYQNRASRAAVIHLQLVCFASALLTHLRLEHTGAHGQRPRDKAADRSTTAAQDQRRRLVGDDCVASLKEKHHDESMLAALERRRVA